MGCLASAIGVGVLLAFVLALGGVVACIPLIVVIIIHGLFRKKFSPSKAWTVLTYIVGIVLSIVGVVLTTMAGSAFLIYPSIAIAIYSLLSALYYGLRRRKKNKFLDMEAYRTDTGGYIPVPLQEKDRNVSRMSLSRHLDVIRESVYLMQKTSNPDTFFGRYQDVMFHVEKIRTSLGEEVFCEEMFDFLRPVIYDRKSVVNDFLDRCYATGKISQMKDQILRHADEMVPENIIYLGILLKDTR